MALDAAFPFDREAKLRARHVAALHRWLVAQDW